MPLSRHPDIAELLEQYMEDTGRSQQWIIVKDIRTHFQLDESRGPAISGFLSKIHHVSLHSCRYKVSRIETFRDTIPPYRNIRKYFVCQRPVPENNPTAGTRDAAQ